MIPSGGGVFAGGALGAAEAGLPASESESSWLPEDLEDLRFLRLLLRSLRLCRSLYLERLRDLADLRGGALRGTAETSLSLSTLGLTGG